MCGRYVSTRTTADLLSEFDAVDRTEGEAGAADYNVAPTTGVRIVVNRVPREPEQAGGSQAARSDGSDSSGSPGSSDGAPEPVRQVRVARWGLVPSWAKDLSVGNRMINARAESLTGKSAFARPFARRRCLLPADGWFEWQRTTDAEGKPGKQAYLMIPVDGHPLALAGLYEFWKPKEPDAEWVVSTTVITVAAQGELAEIHDRMPLVLNRSAWSRWLDPAETAPTDLLEPGDEAGRESLELRPVSSKVNRVGNNSADLLERVSPGVRAQELF